MYYEKPTSPRPRHELLRAALAVALLAPLGAAPITWNPSATIAGDGDVLNAGLASYGYTLSNSTQTVNGVTFTGSNSFSALGTNVTLSGFTSNSTSAYTGGSSTPWNNLPAAYKTMLQGGDFNSSGAGTVTLGNLALGHVYATQVWINDSRAGATATRQANLTGGGGNTMLVDYNSTNAAGGVGQYTIGGFTADGTTQAFTITGTTAGATQFNALQVRDVTGVWRGNFSGNWDSSTLNFTGGQSFSTVTGLVSNVYFGDTDGFKNAVTANTVTVQAAGVSTGTVMLTGNSVNYTFQNASGSMGITGGTALLKSGTGTVHLASANSYTGGSTVNAGIMNVSGDQGAATGGWAIDTGNGATTVASTVNFNAGSTISVAAGKNITLGGTAGHFGARTLNANGSVSNDGSLLVRRSSTLNVAGDWTQNGTATIATQGGGVATMNVNSGGSFTYANAADFQLNTSTSVGTTTLLAINGGTFTTGSAFRNATGTAATNTASVISLNNGGTIKLSGNVSSLATTAGANFNFQVGSTGAGGIIDTNGSSTTLDRAINDVSSQAGKLTKTGAGTLTLTGSLSYTGSTTVDEGTLRVNTTLTSSPVTVNAAGILAGTGTLGSVTIGADGALAPGASAGTLGIASLGLDSMSILAFELDPLDTSLGAGVNDLVTVTGLLNLNGLLNLTATSGSFAGVTSGTWTLLTYGSLSDGGLEFGNMPTLDEGYHWEGTAGENAYTLSIIPEPRCALLGGLGLLALLRRRR